MSGTDGSTIHEELETLLNDAHEHAYQSQAYLSVILRLQDHDGDLSREENDLCRVLQAAHGEIGSLLESLEQIECANKQLMQGVSA